MKKKVLVLTEYFAAVLLLLFYLWSLSSGMDADVSAEYRMFYIEDKLAYFLADGEMSRYGVNEKCYYVPDGRYRNQGKGWGTVMENGTWTSEAESYLYFQVDVEKGNRYQLRVDTMKSTGKSVIVLVNSKKAGEQKIENSGALNVDIPSSYLHKGINEISMHMRYTDQNEKGMLVTAVELTETCLQDRK